MNYSKTIQLIDAMMNELINLKVEVIQLQNRQRGIGLTEAEKEAERQEILYGKTPTEITAMQTLSTEAFESMQTGIIKPIGKRGRPRKN